MYFPEGLEDTPFNSQQNNFTFAGTKKYVSRALGGW